MGHLREPSADKTATVMAKGKATQGGLSQVARVPGYAPFSHFFMKLVFAAPESGLPS